jgi:hypothetical protein
MGKKQQKGKPKQDVREAAPAVQAPVADGQTLRRSVIARLAVPIGVAGSGVLEWAFKEAWGGVVGDAAVKAVDTIKRDWSGEPTMQATTGSHDLYRLLFGAPGSFYVTAGNDHPRYAPEVGLDSGRRLFTVDYHAFRSIRNFLSLFRKSEVVLADGPIVLGTDSGQIHIGSQCSNTSSREILGTLGSEPLFTAETVRGPLAVAYSMCADYTAPTWFWMGGERKDVPKYFLATRDRRFAKPDVRADGYVKSNFLLLTRLPSKQSEYPSLIIGGLHGFSTRAIEEVLFRLPEEDVAYLVKRLAGSPYYQIVFVVQSVRDEAGCTLAERVRVSRRLPPVAIRAVA